MSTVPGGVSDSLTLAGQTAGSVSGSAASGTVAGESTVSQAPLSGRAAAKQGGGARNNSPAGSRGSARRRWNQRAIRRYPG